MRVTVEAEFVVEAERMIDAIDLVRSFADNPQVKAVDVIDYNEVESEDEEDEEEEEVTEEESE